MHLVVATLGKYVMLLQSTKDVAMKDAQETQASLIQVTSAQRFHVEGASVFGDCSFEFGVLS